MTRRRWVSACRSVACAAAVGVLAALLAAAPGAALGGATSRVQSLMREAEKLTGAHATGRDLARAHMLFFEGEQVLRQEKDVPSDVRYRFYVAAARCARQLGQHPVVLRLLRDAQGAAGPKEAAGAAAEAKRMQPLAEAWVKAGTASGKGDYTGALRQFQEIARKHPEAKAHALARQAEVHVRMRRYAEAVAVERRIADAYKGTREGERALAEMGNILLVMGQPRKALAAYQECLKTHGDAGERGLVHHRIGRAYAELGQREEALRELALARKALRFLEGDARKRMEKEIAEAEAKAKAIKAR